MTWRKRRNHSSAFKAKVALSAVKGERSMFPIRGPTGMLSLQPRRWSIE